MDSCPECDFWRSVGADTCRRCDRRFPPLQAKVPARPRDAREERWSVAQAEKRCIVCWHDRTPWAWLTWWRCGKCRSFHCGDCRDRYLSGGLPWREWTCQYCGHVEGRGYWFGR